ncbi:hypothetical protein KKH18_00005 [bacterium]|nr:hypothetical protein [bacterium]
MLPTSKLSLSFPETSPCVVIGENGSGKSLVAASILAALDPQAASSLLRELAQAGLYTITLSLSRGDEALDLHVDLREGTRSVQKHSGESLEHVTNGTAPGFHGDELLFKNGILFKHLHSILNGEIGEPEGEALMSIANALRTPLLQELDSWESRLHVLTGDDGHSGQLVEIKQRYSEAEENWKRVKSLHQDIERIKQRRNELNAQLAEAVTAGEVLKVEREEIERSVGLAERASRVENWLAEVHRDIARVESLRDEHAKTQEELDQLAGKFRGAPDSFPELLDEYETAINIRRSKQTAWDELETSRSALQDEILDVERDLGLLKPPQNEGIQSRIDELQREIQADETLLVNLLRDRISLLRKREGLEQRLHSDYAAIALLDRPVLDAIRKECSQHRAGQRDRDSALQSTEDQRLLQKRLDDLERMLREDYQDFETLSEHAEDEILDLHITKSAISESSDLLESLQARRTDAQAIGKGPRWIAAIIAAAFIAGLPLGIYLGWDIGLFAGSIGSGLVWMIYRNTHKAAEKRVLELAQHENNVRQRWKSAVEARTMLEGRLGPLAGLKKGEALEKLASYESMKKERAQLVHSRKEPEQGISNSEQPPADENRLACFAGMTNEQVLSRIQEYESLIAEKKVFDQQWKDFESGGEIAVQIEQLESRVSRRKGDVEALRKTQAEEARRYSSRKQTLTVRLADLKSKLPNNDEIESLSKAISELEIKLADVAEASSQILMHADPKELRDAWQRFGSLKQRQRSLKDELSACLSLEEIRSRRSILTDELLEVTGKLSDLDPLYLKQGNATYYARKYEDQLDAISQQISDNLIEAEAIRHELDTLETDFLLEQIHSLPTLETLESDMGNFEEQLENIQRESRTTQELVETLNREIQKIDAELPDQIASSINHFIQRYFGDDFGTVYYDENEWILKSGATQLRKVRSLSRGQADMLRLVIRIAALNLLDSIEDDFVIWDDVLGNLDDRRIETMQNLIEVMAEKRQVILFSRDSRLAREGEVVQLKPAGNISATSN